MNKILIILSLVLLAACGLSRDEKQNIAINACSIMGETKKSEAVFRIQTMSDAREKIGGETYIRGDDAIIEAFELGLCQQLVMNEDYEWYRNVARNELRKRERVAAEKRAEEQRIADSKPTVKEEFYSNGKLKNRTTYQSKIQSKIDGAEKYFIERYHENGQLSRRGNYKDGEGVGTWEYYHDNGQLSQKGNYKDGKQEGLWETYRENGQLESKVHWKDGIRDGLRESYHENGQLEEKGNYLFDLSQIQKRDGLWVSYHENGELKSKVCYKNGKNVDMSNCTE